MKSKNNGVVLIVGDSFIDENWLMSFGGTYHSYNVGREHYVSNLHSADSRIISYCGAASLWRMLHGPEQHSKPNNLLSKSHALTILSAWNPDDASLLRCLLCNKADVLKGLTPFRISGLPAPITNEQKGTVRCPMDGRSCKYKPSMLNLVKEECTQHTSSNRLIRLYEGFGSDQPRLHCRFDWRLDLEDEYKKENIIDEIESTAGDTPIEAIVVLDHGYGVVDERLVTQLHNASPDAKWYVRCKVDSPKWMQALANESKRLRLLFRDEQLLMHAYGNRVWRHGSKILGRGALEVLGDLLGIQTYEHTEPITPNHIEADHAALLFENNTVIAASRTDDSTPTDALLVNISRSPGETMPIRVGRSTVFFASLVYLDLMGSLDKSLNNACDWALNNAYRWTKHCTDAWLAENPEDLCGPFAKAIYATDPPKNKVSSTIAAKEHLGYEQAWKEWNMSSEKLGIVNVGEERQFQLWRAQGALRDFNCPGGSKRSNINSLITRLESYRKEQNPRHPFNSLFLAEPGWGKSYLAECLAQYFKFEPLRFSIADMGSNQDLKNCLKEIASTQNRARRRVLVFMDEIDANIESHSAMGLLLGPMWDGKFTSEGNVYRIEPCVWVFASTKPLSSLRRESKGRDFLSRVNGPIIDLDFFGNAREELEKKEEKDRVLRMADVVRDQAESKPLRTELVYHGVNFLNRLFGPIASIDESVLRVFYNTMPIDGIRSIEILVSRFQDISGGRVSIRNVPVLNEFPELERLVHILSKWPTEDIRPIKVMTNPPK